MAEVLLVDVYSFASSGNKFVSKKLQAIPLPVQFVTAQSPDPTVFVYSKILYEMPKGMIQEAYVAESVSSLASRVNS
jgi:hypothetical protein